MKTSQLIASALAIPLALCGCPALSAAEEFSLSVPHPTHPLIASEFGIDGLVMLGCRPTRRKSTCAVLEESPEGFGFGAAALGVSRNIKVTDGPIPPHVSVPIRFKAPPIGPLAPPPSERSLEVATRWFDVAGGPKNLDAPRSAPGVALGQLSPGVRQAVEATYADGPKVAGTVSNGAQSGPPIGAQ